MKASRPRTEIRAIPPIIGKYQSLLQKAGLSAAELTAGTLIARTPIDGSELGRLTIDDASSIDHKVAAAQAAFQQWREVPPPKRGELLRLFMQQVRAQHSALAQLISLEAGKIASEALGEVQEVIDICEFAIGLSRQLHGLTIASERAGHHLLERWQPLGPVGVITAFNFPMGVWAWNAALALICGDTIVWKPSEKAPLCALALHRLLLNAVAEHGQAPANLSQLVIGEHSAGAQLAAHASVPLISATGSAAMGRSVGPVVAARLGRSLLELGGNNAAIVAPSADLSLTVHAVVFAAVGTSGQRCTTLRRLYVHASLYQRLLDQLKHSYASLAIGDPLQSSTLMGPLIDASAFEQMQAALASARAAGAKVTGGERVAIAELAGGYYVRPAIVELAAPIAIMQQETFAPILYVLPYENYADALAQQNSVRQGLSSAVFTNDLREAETFLSASGSDCGIANVNCGTSGVEVGGAFGGEKDTGGGREAGSDSWKSYMRRQTQSINYSSSLPLSQGVRFDLD
jgi:aldehyde dehydrogenase (NAD+)